MRSGVDSTLNQKFSVLLVVFVIRADLGNPFQVHIPIRKAPPGSSSPCRFTEKYVRSKSGHLLPHLHPLPACCHSAAAMAAMASEWILSKHGYTNVRILGGGAFGTVYACTSSTGAEVAVKISFGPHALVSEREAAMMSIAPPHPNVLRLVDFQTETVYALLATPLATGGDTLKFMLNRRSVPLSEMEARGLFAQLVDGVDHLHRHGVVHRDIKCENLLLTGPRRRQLIIADFGFATRYKHGQLLTDIMGSLHYSAPEICKSVPYDGAAVDIWAMGVVLLAWCTGRLPFGGATEAEIQARICAGSYNVPGGCSRELAALVKGMLTVNAAKRFTMGDIRKSAWMRMDAHASQAQARSSSEPTVVLAAAPEPEQQQQEQQQADTIDKQRRRNSADKGRLPTRLFRAIFKKGS